MKIVAYSKIPAATPFVHLGYLAASTIKPVAGLFWSGVVLVIASVITRRFLARRKSVEPVVASGLRAHKLRIVRLALLLLGITIIVGAYAFGKKAYLLPDEMTQMLVMSSAPYLDKTSEPGNDPNVVVNLPTQEGEYDLGAVLSVPWWPAERYADAWNTPLIVRATRQEGRLTYMVASAGRDRTWGTQDDITGTDGRLKH